MSTVGDFNQNSMQAYNNSLKEGLKRTMLSQEVMFRKQVHELHRVYRIQKTLMVDFGWIELDSYHLWKASMPFVPFSNPLQCSTLAEGKLFSRTPMVSSSQFESSCDDFCSHQRRPFDLQLPADRYVNQVNEDILEKGNGWGMKEPVEIKHLFRYGNISSAEDVKLTLRIGGDTRKKGCGNRTFEDNIIRSSSNHVVDLEESTGTVLNEPKSVSTFSCAAITNGHEHESRNYVASQVSAETVKKDLSLRLTRNYSFVDSNESYDEQIFFNQGSKGRHRDIPCYDKTFTSYDALGLDLNKVQCDDSSYLIDPTVPCLPNAGTSGTFNGVALKYYEATSPTSASWRKPNVNCSNEPSSLLWQHDVANSTFIDPDSSKSTSSNVLALNASFAGISQSEVRPIDLESMSETEPLSDICEDPDIDRRNSGNGDVELLLKFPKGNHKDVTAAKVTENIKEDLVFGKRAENTNNSTTSGELACVGDDCSSGAKTTDSGIDLGGSDISTRIQFEISQSSQITESESVEQGLRSSNSTELKHQSCGKKLEEPTGVDVLIRTAAESLVQFSLATGNQDCCAEAGSNEIVNKGRDQPQISLDSYEAIVLKLTESRGDDYCVSSKPLEVNEPDKKDFGNRLRRGRRLKDFQRDVLPALSSLSKHEIREDITIMETVIRSREYKRMRSKMAGVGNWFAPVKSKRSRLNYVGRRYYS